MGQLYINDEFCKNLEQLKDYFNDCLSDNDVYTDLLESARCGMMSQFLRDLDEEQLADTIDSIDGDFCDSDYMSQLIATITGDKYRIEKPHYSKCFKIEKVTCNETNNRIIISVRIKILEHVNENFVMKIVGISTVGDFVINTYKIEQNTLLKEFNLPDYLDDFQGYIEINGEKIEELNGVKQVIPISENISITMIKVYGGEFWMGATDKQAERSGWLDAAPRHKVVLSDYYIGQTVVTQELWKFVMGKNPSHFRHPQKPVENISWYECEEFVEKLNQITGKHFRLPTEAEWEYAARGGRLSKNFIYAGSDKLDDVAWYKKNSKQKTHKVGNKAPNELQLYDMSGNVWEWCLDWYSEYSNRKQINPHGPHYSYLTTDRVVRGGSAACSELGCEVFARGHSKPEETGIGLGVRLVME